ncbi:MAG: TetR/AcrR family transcriptional regulator [Acidimicrobiales bacterium]
MARRGEDAPTPDRILGAAAERFATKGFHATTTREIAAAAGVRGASVYHHFPSKETILYRIALGTMQELLAGARAAVDTAVGPERQLRRLVECHVRYHAEHPLPARVADEQLHALDPDRRAEVVQVRDTYERLLRGILLDGRDRLGWQVDDVDVATYAIATMATGVCVWFRGDGRLPVDAVASIYGDLAVRAVAGAPLAAGVGVGIAEGGA